MTSGRLPTSGKLSYLYERSPTHRHRGVDLVAPEGTPVYAAAGGLVRHATRAWKQGFTGYGRVVVVQSDDGRHELYAHLSTVDVTEGERVARGESIGTVGRTTFDRADHESQTVGPHLHFEVSARPYPMQPEAEREDPVTWLLSADHVHPLTGGPPAAAPASSSSSSSSSSNTEGSPAAERPLASQQSRCSVPCPSCGRGLVVTVAYVGGSTL